MAHENTSPPEIWRFRTIFKLNGVVIVNTFHCKPIDFSVNTGTPLVAASGEAAFTQYLGSSSGLRWGSTFAWSGDGVCIKGPRRGDTIPTQLISNSGHLANHYYPSVLAIPIRCYLADSSRSVTYRVGPVPHIDNTGQYPTHRFTAWPLLDQYQFMVNRTYTDGGVAVIMPGTPRYQAGMWSTKTHTFHPFSHAAIMPWWTTGRRRRAGPYGLGGEWPTGVIGPGA